MTAVKAAVPALVAAALIGAAVGAFALHMVSSATLVTPVTTAARPEAADPLDLDAKSSAAAGIGVAPLALAAGAVAQGQGTGIARALDLSPLAVIAAEITAATAARQTSGRELARLESLAGQDQSASRREVEAARAQAVADRARLTLACQRVGLEYGAGLGQLGCRSIPALAAKAASGDLVLLRIDMPDGPPPAGTSVTVGEGAQAARLTVLGPASSGDAQLQTAGVLALWQGSGVRVASVGRALPAVRLASGRERARSAELLVPRSAIVRVDGGLFVYRAKPGQGFERMSIAAGHAADAGWLVPTGALHAGDNVAVQGAGTLLGLEHAAPSAAD
ncbi:hypothetical protein [Novosphingobium sp. FKTRR1]|uniref:hypothetical protein n=1 Tax=Novosphingobium sp. FKTRR1 TaxID=2879118 RepID=UPI001CF0C061|nr:hypothetical protein [Novosphingobium sp. FKTRR1]